MLRSRVLAAHAARGTLRSLRVPLLLVAIALPVWGCPGVGPVVPCPMIPDGGCPVQSGGTCADPTCAVLYTCENEIGKWVAVKTCTRGGPGGSGGGGGGVGGSVPDGGPCTPPPVDLGPDAGLSQGCTEDLQDPDCPIAAAEPCVETACLTGCSDFFICTMNPAPGCPDPPCWVDVAYCDDAGDFVVTQ